MKVPSKSSWTLQLFNPTLGGIEIEETNCIEIDALKPVHIVDAPLTPDAFVHLYETVWKLAFHYIKTAKNGLYNIMWGNFSCILPPWKLQYESGAMKVADFLAKTELYKRECLFFPFFEDMGWAWLLVVRLHPIFGMSIYDFSSGSNKTIDGTIDLVYKFLQEAWHFYNRKQFIRIQPKKENTPQVHVTMSGWWMLYFFESLVITSGPPLTLQVNDLRAWLKEIVPEKDKTLVAFPPEQLVRLSQLARCDLK